MTLAYTAVFGAVAVLILLALNARLRPWAILLASLVAVYALQPSMPVRNLDYWLPTASIALCGFAWALTRPAGTPVTRESWLAAGLALAVMLGVALLRYIEPLCCLTPTRPPAALQVLAALVLVALVGLALARFGASKKALLAAAIVVVLALFIIIKTEALAALTSAALRALQGQSPELARATDLRWLGFSYIAFRIIHTLRDRQNGRLAALPLGGYLSYALFFPALTAGPIDRVERFNKDLAAQPPSRADALAEGGKRLAVGLFKKFVLADTLALVALNEANFGEVHSAGWMWVLLYAYALRIYFDFSGYTDMAIGLGRWMGVRLPENFDRPYLKPNLTAFWNSWHITLAQWFRAYFFNPLTRAMRGGKITWSPVAMILVGQLATMILIGLWHGVTWNFVIWGAWHGLGLFVHSRWLDFIRTRGISLPQRWQKPAAWLSTILTFNYVALGWVWFVLPHPQQSLAVLARLFGGG